MSDLRKCWSCDQIIEGEFWTCYDCYHDPNNPVLDGSTESYNISRFLGMVYNDLLTDEEWQTIIDSRVGIKILVELIWRMDRKCLKNIFRNPKIAEAVLEADKA